MIYYVHNNNSGEISSPLLILTYKPEITMTVKSIQEVVASDTKPLKINNIVKWAGGKSWCKNLIVDFWRANQRKVFVEPFAGGLSSTMAIKPEKAILNDINPHVINLYNQIQNGLTMSIPLLNTESKFLEHRLRFNALIHEDNANTKEGAELFYYLNRTCFNGLCRFNKKGFFNVPFGRYNKINYRSDFAVYQEMFKNYSFTCADFEQLVTDNSNDSFYFIDSPYDDGFTDYTKEGFTWDDQVRLIDWASKLEGPVLMTNKATDRILEVLRAAGFQTKIIKKKHTIGAASTSRKVIDEVFAWKNLELPANYPVSADWKKVMTTKKAKTKVVAKVKKAA